MHRHVAGKARGENQGAVVKESPKDLRLKLYERQRKLVNRGDYLRYDVLTCLPGELVKLNPKLLK